MLRGDLLTFALGVRKPGCRKHRTRFWADGRQPLPNGVTSELPVIRSVVQSASITELAISRSSRIFNNLGCLCRLRADSRFRSQSGEPYPDAPLLGPREPRQSVLEKQVPAGAMFRWEIRP